MKNTSYLMIVVLFLSCCTGKREKSNECQKVSTMTLLENVSHAYVKVTFPSTAVDAPALMFGRYKSPESTEADHDSWELVEFDQWWGKDQLGEGVPLMASGRNDMLEKMLSYDILYISFISEDLSERTPGGYEIARVHLKSFKEAYFKHQQDL